MKSHSFLFVFVLLLSAFGMSYSQSADSTKVLEEVVISVNRIEEQTEKIPQQIKSIGEKEISRQQVQTTADLLQNTGMVQVQKSQAGGGSPVLRGFEANRILLMLDGVRLNNLIYRGGHLQNIITNDQTILDRIEVSYGPASTVYGSDALGGMIGMYTRNPKFAPAGKNISSGKGMFRYGSVNNERTTHADINLAKGRIASLTSFTYSSFGDLVQGKKGSTYQQYWRDTLYAGRGDKGDVALVNHYPHIQKNTAYSQYNLLQKLATKQGENILHSVNLQFANSSNINRYDRLSEISNGVPTYAEWYYGPQTWGLASYKFENLNKKKYSDAITAQINYQYYNESRNTRRFGSNNLTNRNERVNNYSYTVFSTKEIGKNRIITGLDGYFNTLKSTAYRQNILTGEISGLDTRYPDGNNAMYSNALYVSHNYKISDKLLLNDGLRLTNTMLSSSFNDKTYFPFPYTSYKQNNTALCGNAGLVYIPAKVLRITTQVSNGFRNPNVDDLSKVFESGAGRIIVPNPDIKPERTYNFDFGVHISNKYIRFENFVFYTLFNNAIVADRFTFNGADSIAYDGKVSAVYANQNNQEAYLYGYSGLLKIMPASYLTLYANTTYTYGRIKTDTTDAPLDHIPPVFGKAGIIIEKNKVWFDVYILFNGKKALADYKLNGEDNELYATKEGMPAWYTLNVKVSVKPVSNVYVAGGVENILDKNYRVFSSGVSAPGRNIYLSLTVSF